MMAPEVSVTVPESDVDAPPPCANAGTLAARLSTRQNRAVKNRRAVGFI
jgi:hypothetical protein